MSTTDPRPQHPEGVEKPSPHKTDGSQPGSAVPADVVEAAYASLLESVRKNRPDVDEGVLRSAFEYARDKHAVHQRESGEPYILHPLAVAGIIADLGLDQVCLVSALCHDVLEMTETSPKEIEQRFGEDVRRVVEGLTKVEHLVSRASLSPEGDETGGARTGPSGEAEARERPPRRVVGRAENLRHFLLAMVEDFRVIPVKLADRLHNMRTLSAKDPASQARIALETEQLYAPLAHRIGLWQLKWELEDLAFKYFQPEQYKQVAAMVAATQAERQSEVDEAVRILSDYLHERGLKNATVTGRAKHLYSIYRKIVTQNRSIEDIYDLVALRVIVHTRMECYTAQGLITEIWKPVPGYFADYIGAPKANLYQSIHMKVIGPQGKPIEIQIRTWQMHQMAEFGLAAHWRYKEEGEESQSSSEADQRIAQLRKLLFDWSQDPANSDMYRSVLQSLYGDQIVVFSPRGDPYELPRGATVLDFAYRIHTEVGHHAIGARINGRFVELGHACQSGDTIQVVTRSNSWPSLDWLLIVKTTHARSKIKAYFRKQSFDVNVERGRSMLATEAAKAGIDAQQLQDAGLEEVARGLNYPGVRDMLAGLGSGSLTVQRVLRRLMPREQVQPATPATSARRAAPTGAVAAKVDNIANVICVQARCCMPLPGDVVVGYASRGLGFTIHREGCPNLANLARKEPGRLHHDIEYLRTVGRVFPCVIRVVAVDRQALLADVASAMAEMGVNIVGSKTVTRKGERAIMEFAVELHDAQEYHRLEARIHDLVDVVAVDRPFSGAVIRL